MRNTLNRKYLMQAIDGSLERFQQDFVDVLYCHRADPETTLEETVWAMSDIISAGKALYWGTSEWAADEIRGAGTPFFGGDGPLTYAGVHAGVTGYLARWREKGHLLRANTLLELSDAATHQFWNEVTEGILTSIAAFFDAQRSAGVLPPGPPASRELVRVLFSMLWKTGYDL